MDKELIKTIDATIENICKWADKEFTKKELTYYDLMKMLDSDKHNSQEESNNTFNRKLKLINSISELLQARANIECSLPIMINGENLNNIKIE